MNIVHRISQLILFVYIPIINAQPVNSNSNTMQDRIQKIIDKTVDNKRVFGAAFSLRQDSTQLIFNSGNIKQDEHYFIASTTKLFTSAMILQLKSEGMLKLKDPLSKYFDSGILKGLHVLKGVDYSYQITVEQLLAHTSGLPDYFQDKNAQGVSLENQLVSGNDVYWSFEDAVNRSKKLKPKFKPGTPGKAHYSDLNFQLLGKIIEKITGLSYSDACNIRIIEPLELKSTYLFQDSFDDRPHKLYYKSSQLNIPKAMVSFGPDGGMVSNQSDMLVFIQAFFQGKLFPKEYLDWMQDWNDIFSPLQSGIGIHRFKLPWYFNPTGAVPVFIGHSGLSGALAYYAPQENLFIVGTVNQIAYPSISFQTMIKISLEMKKGHLKR